MPQEGEVSPLFLQLVVAFPGGLTLHMVLLSAWDQTEQIAIENIAKTSCTAVNKIMM